MCDPNVLLVGPISLSNKGTAAIVASTIWSLRTAIPDLILTVELFYPEQQRTLMDLEADGVRVVAPLIQSPLRAIALFALAILWYPLVRFHIAKPLSLSAFRHYNEADIVVDISAEAFVTYFDDDFLQQIVRFGAHLYPVLLGVLLNKPIAFYAQTMAPFGVFRPLMRWLIKRASMVTVRDPASMENLRREGVDISKVHLTADPAFLLESQQPPYCPERRGTGPVIGLSAARQTGRTLGTRQYEVLLQTLSEAARRLIQDLDATIVFIPHSSGKFKKVSDDIAVGLEICKRVGNNDRFYVIQEEWSPQQLKGLIAECDALLSLRMHPVIAALSTGVPSVILAFNDKAIGLMQRFGLAQYVCRIDKLNVDELVRAVKDSLTNKVTIRHTLLARLDAMRDLAMENARLLRELLAHQ